MSRQEVVNVERVIETLLGLTERAGAGDATQHEEAEVVGVYGHGSINHLTCLAVAIERVPYEVDIVSKGQTKALLEHEVVEQ
jgi:hypothetical protein